jgi:putative transposase
MVTPVARREAVAYVKTAYDVSERRACKSLNIDRACIRYRSRRQSDGGVRDVLRKLSYERHRFGYRRLHQLLRETDTGSIIKRCIGCIEKKGCR